MLLSHDFVVTIGAVVTDTAATMIIYVIVKLDSKAWIVLNVR